MNATSTAPKPAAKPAFSFAGLSIEDAAEMPKVKGAGRTSGPNPILPHFKASADKRIIAADKTWRGAVKAVTVPAENASEVGNLIRRAAESLKVGSRIDFATPTGERVEIVSVGGTKKVTAGGKERMTGGTLEPQVKGKKYTGQVRVTFCAKSPKVTKKATAAAPAAPSA